MSNTFLTEHEHVFHGLVENLTTMGKTIDPKELIILYANSLPMKTFGTWIQGQMSFIAKFSLTEFKGHVREEVCHLNSILKKNSNLKGS